MTINEHIAMMLRIYTGGTPMEIHPTGDPLAAYQKRFLGHLIQGARRFPR
jgi:hypothetical protein